MSVDFIRDEDTKIDLEVYIEKLKECDMKNTERR